VLLRVPVVKAHAAASLLAAAVVRAVAVVDVLVVLVAAVTRRITKRAPLPLRTLPASLRLPPRLRL
jgi:hypothetical protein